MVAAESAVQIEIQRKVNGVACNTGYLLVNGNPICYTLELPDAANIMQISAIPAGTYTAHLRYDHADAWRFELDDVPGRTNVQIHVGNWTSDSHGCILVGTSVSIDDCSVSNSADAYNQFETAVYGAVADGSAPPDIDGATVTVSDP